MVADAFVEIGKYLFGYPAGKARLTKKLIPLIPPHRVYTEAFCGSAAVFFDKEAAPVEALNDRDKEVVAALRAVRGLTRAELEQMRARDWIGSRSTFDRLKKLTPTGRVDLLHRFLYLTLFGFRRARRSYAPDMDGRNAGPGIMRRLEKSCRRMHRGVKVFAGDYEDVIRKYDAPDAFHFLDPPYPGYDVGVGESEFDEARFRKLLEGIKGKFLITYGVRGKLDTSGFKVRKISPRRYLSSERGNKGPDALDTLLIANYDFKMAALDLGDDWGEEITVSDSAAEELAHLGAVTRSTAAWLSTFVRKCAGWSQAGSVRELARALGPVAELGDVLAAFGDAPPVDVPANPEHAVLALSSALKAFPEADLPELLKDQQSDADAGLAQFLAALHVLNELDHGDPPASVGKLAISEMDAKLLREIGDDDLAQAHDQLHRLFEGNFAGDEAVAFKGGMRRLDLVRAELLLQAEMKRRGKPCSKDDALAKEAASVQTEKGDIDTSVFPIVPGQGKPRKLPPSVADDEDEDEIDKRVLTTRERNDFPDSSFLYVKPGGDKDGEGKTVPRSLRMFPVRDKDGKLLMPQLRNALARIPQADIPQALKDRLAARARRMLDEATKRVDKSLFDLPDEEPQRGAIQYHFHDRSMHVDFRAQVDGHCVGWTFNGARDGMIGDGVHSVERAEQIGKSFSLDGDRYVRSMREPGWVSAIPKLRQPLAWLEAKAELFEEFEPGATATAKGVLVEVASPTVEFGVQRDDLHEYFLYDGDISGVLNVRKIGGEWRASIAASNLPAVLRDGAELPPPGRSSLPASLRGDVPVEFRYWTEKGEKAKRVHEALIKSRTFTEDNVRIVNGEFRRVVRKTFLATVDDEPVGRVPWPERVEHAIDSGDPVAESFGALRKAEGAIAYYDAGCNGVDGVVDRALTLDAPFVITAKDSPRARDALSRIGEVFKFVPDRATALDAMERIFVSSLPLRRTGGVEFLHHVPDAVIKQEQDAETRRKKELWTRWRELINMSPSEIKAFLDSDLGREAGLSDEEASAQGIGRGRDSARALLRMLPSGRSFDGALENWSANDWRWAGRQVSFISRMRGNKGPLVDDKGKPTRKLTSLLVWGHDPRKKQGRLFDSVLEREIPLLKTKDERFVLGIVLEPEVRDAQGDIYSEEEVRTAAHAFMEQFQNIGFMHRELINDKVSILESYVTPVAFEIDGQAVRKGTWLFATRINDGGMWDAIKTGKLGGYSIGGSAVRVPERGQD